VVRKLAAFNYAVRNITPLDRSWPCVAILVHTHTHHFSKFFFNTIFYSVCMHAIVYFFQACRPNYLMLRRNACSYLYLCPNFYLFCGKSAEIHSGKTETALSKRRRLFLSFSKPNVFDSAKRRCLSHPQNVYIFPKTHPAS